MAASRCSQNQFISEKYKTYNHLSYISFNSSLVQLENFCHQLYKEWETFLEAILWKTFQHFRCILNVSSITKEPSLWWWFQTREQVKISWRQVGKVWGWSSVVTMFFAQKSLSKTDPCAGALSWRRNQLLVLHFSRCFLLTAYLGWRTKLWDIIFP